MNAGGSVSENETSRYHTELIRSLAEVGKMPIAEERFEVVRKFLETTSKITKSDRISIYEFVENEGFRRQYLYDSEAGAGHDLKPLVLKKNEFLQWIETFQSQDSVIFRKREEIPESDLETYERICEHKINSMIAFRLTHNGEMSGCMILENPDINESKVFIELIPLIDVFLGNVKKNYQNETDRKIRQDLLDENALEIKWDRQFLEVLSRDYTTVYHLDLINDTLEPLKLTDTANATQMEVVRMREKINYTQHMKFYCKEYIASRNQEEILKSMERSNLYNILSKNNRYVYRYESKPNMAGQKFFEVQVVRVNEKEFDGHALMAFRHIDDIVSQELRQHQELEEALEKERVNNEILSAIGKIYYAIFRINLDKDVYEEINSEEEVHHLTGKRGCASAEMMEICKTFVVPEYQERIQRFFDLSTLSDRLKDEETIAEEYLARDGNWHTARFIVKRRNSDGRVTHVLYVTRLISDTKRREQNWIAIAEEANRANEAKSEFISQIAHDIRTPMNAIFGFQEIAQANIEDQDKVKYCLKKIRHAGDFMQELVNDVLDITRMENGKMELHPETISLTETVSEFPSALKHAKRDKELTINSNIHDITHDKVIVDSLRIKQIYSNILSNAIKYTPDHGSVTFEVYEEAADDTSKVRVVAVISDTGIGMSEEYMDKMYAKFSRETDTRINKVSGYGLGLSIVRQLVDMMDGTITVKSKIGEGTVFCIKLELPYVEATENVESEVRDSLKEKSYAGVHLLVAEDNDLNFEVISELLSMHQITCERAVDGIDCIEKFRKADQHTYDAILMDMQMPNMDGVEATKNIRKLDCNGATAIPIIAMTANAFKEDVKKCMDAGMNEYLSKPVDMKKLLDVLEKYCK